MFKFVHRYVVESDLTCVLTRAGPFARETRAIIKPYPRSARDDAMLELVQRISRPHKQYRTCRLTLTSHYLENAHEARSHFELCVAELCAFYRSLSYQQVSLIGHLVESGSIVAGVLANLENSVLPERLAVLIYLCATFNDLGHSPGRMQYISRLEEKLA